MTITARALRELHRIHRQLTDLRERLDRGPKQIQAADASIRRVELELGQARETAKKLRIHTDEKNLQLKGREDRIKDLKGKLNACSSNREYQTLKDQIAADEQANSVLADEILEGLERLDELAAQVKQAEDNLVRIRHEAEKTRARVAEEQQSLQSELTRVQAELTQAETALPSDFRQEYDRITKARGEDALAPVEGDCCSGCFRVLTAQTINELQLSHLVLCKNCGSLLYLPEDPKPLKKEQ